LMILLIMAAVFSIILSFQAIGKSIWINVLGMLEKNEIVVNRDV
jgi:hypothetical protein